MTSTATPNWTTKATAADSLAARIAAAAIARFADRADNEAYEQWGNGDLKADYIAVLRTGTAWVVNEQRVVASVVNTPDGRTWGYTASEALDGAYNDVDGIPDTVEIEKVSPTMYALTW